MRAAPAGCAPHPALLSSGAPSCGACRQPRGLRRRGPVCLAGLVIKALRWQAVLRLLLV